MKKIILILFLLLILAGAIAAWIFLGPATAFDGKTKSLYISSEAATPQAVMDSLEKNEIVSNISAFKFLAERMDYWKKIKPGRYDIDKGTSLLKLVRRLRNGQQTPLDLVITKLRTKEDLALRIGRKFETDSLEMIRFLNNPDSLIKYNADAETAMWIVLPDTYRYFWTATPSDIYEKFYDASQRFWNDERKRKAGAIGLTPREVVILASIIEEETTKHSEKDTIASVYLNRLRIGMALGADPTLKFATRQFGLKRIAGDILETESPYNTYNNPGLPPGPICTPSKITIDKVLNPADTKYLYFVARTDLVGHLFSETHNEHLRKRAAYLAADRRRREAESSNKSND